MCMKFKFVSTFGPKFSFFQKFKAIDPKRHNILHLAVSFVGQFYGFTNTETALL